MTSLAIYDLSNIVFELLGLFLWIGVVSLFGNYESLAVFTFTESVFSIVFRVVNYFYTSWFLLAYLTGKCKDSFSDFLC